MTMLFFTTCIRLEWRGRKRETHWRRRSHRFDELKKWIPHIEEIGCNAIYIGPLFESSTHGYDTRDYKTVDRRLGDNQDFKEFVQEAHRRDIRGYCRRRIQPYGTRILCLFGHPEKQRAFPLLQLV